MVIKEITSRNNPDFKMFIRLLKGQGLKKHGLTLISGMKQTLEVIRDFPERCQGAIAAKGSLSFEGLSEDIPRYILSGGLFREVDIHGTGPPILLVRVPPLPIWQGESLAPGCTLFIPFQDPANVGAVIRCAAAFGVARIVLLKESAHPFHHKSVRAAGSTVLRVPLAEGPSISQLVTAEFPIITLSAKGENIHRYSFPPAFGLLPGLEGPGLPTEVNHLPALAIPMEPGVESLNAAVATGIALYVWRSGEEPRARANGRRWSARGFF
jgi:tRNA G18 (ribose-2'-O)-methylase SpoU